MTSVCSNEFGFEEIPQEDKQKEIPQDESTKGELIASYEDYRKQLFRLDFCQYECTYNSTYENQIYFNCDTCFPNNPDMGLCHPCINRCRINGHDVDMDTFHFGPFFCDLGHRKAGSPNILNFKSEGSLKN